jgi:uncharacterized protein (TIGR02996 family)
MSDDDFLRAILDDPDDDDVRLVYADWLEEHDQNVRAEFIRVQVALANLDEDDPDCLPLREREQALLAENEAAWRAVLPEWLAGSRVEFRRGFVGGLSLSVEDFIPLGHLLFQCVPLDGADLHHAANSIDALTSCPHLGRLRRLKLGTGIRSEEAGWLVHSPRVARLRSLDLAGNNIGRVGATDLSVSPHLAELTTLILTGNDIQNAGALALATSECLPNLTTLDLRRTGASAKGIEAVFRSTRLPNLRELRLGDEWAMLFGYEIPNILASVDWPANLVRLHLERCHFGPYPVERLIQESGFVRLRALDLRNNLLGDAGAAHLAASPRVSNLRRLHLGNNRITDAGVKALVESPNLLHLHTLDVSGNAISPETCEGLRQRFGRGAKV